MECDYDASEERKESDGDALLEAAEEAVRSLDDSPMQIDQGQQRI